jgi:hypothetical protein
MVMEFSRDGLAAAAARVARPGVPPYARRMAVRVFSFYIDYKSSYVYLAKDPARQLEREFDVRLDWLPCTLRIPEFLGNRRRARRPSMTLRPL